MGGLAGALFGEEPTTTTTPTSGYGTLPQDIRDFSMNELFPLIQDIGTSRETFEPIPFTQEGQMAINALATPENFAAGFNPQFNFGKRASAALDQAGQTLGSALPVYQQGVGLTGQGSQAITGEEIQGSIGDFFNPYQQQVVDATRREGLQDLEQQQAALRARTGRAFGGTRAGVAEGALSAQGLQNIDDLTGRLRASGFESAASRGLNRLQTDRGRMLQGGGQMGSLAGGIGNIGAQQVGLGSNLMNARMNVDQLANSAFQRNQSQRQTAIADMLRSDQLRRQQQAQEQGIPLQQVQFMNNTLPFFQSGQNVSQQPGSAGLLGGYGSRTASGINLIGGLL